LQTLEKHRLPMKLLLLFSINLSDFLREEVNTADLLEIIATYSLPLLDNKIK
jgi:hypothetical protein